MASDQVRDSLSSALLDLMQRTGYPLVQHNGQRKFGPPSDWTGPTPQKGCEVFIGKLPREIFEDELVPIFSKVGKIYEMRLMMDFSGSNRGYGFVTYATRVEAFRAVKELNGYQVRPGRPIGVVKSVDNCRLYVGGIPKLMTKMEIYEEFSKRVSGIVDVILYRDCFDRNLNRGFAFLEFVSHRAAAMARRALVPGFVKIWDQEVTVDWAEPEPDEDHEQMSKQFELMEYDNSRKEDEGIGSAGSACGSPTDNRLFTNTMPPSDCYYTSPPAKLDSICKRYMWAPPIYNYLMYPDSSGAKVWIGSMELPHVGAPIVSSPCRIGPLTTRPCLSMQQAQVAAAETALHCIKMLRKDLIQRSCAAVSPPMYQPLLRPVLRPAVPQVVPPVVPPTQPCVSRPCEYPTAYSRQLPPTPVTFPQIWRTL